MLIKLSGLALVDSVGVGTLVVPLWMMIRPSFRVSAVLLHLSVLGLLYLGVGLVLLTVSGDVSVPGDAGVRLATGVVVLLSGLICERRRSAGSSWSTRPPTSARGIVLFAVAVGAVEVATMLPYLAAIDAVAEADRGWASSVSLLAAYVLIALSPALVILFARVVAKQSISSILLPVMRHADRWSGDVVGTVLIVVGALLAAGAAIELNLV